VAGTHEEQRGHERVRRPARQLVEQLDRHRHARRVVVGAGREARQRDVDCPREPQQQHDGRDELDGAQPGVLDAAEPRAGGRRHGDRAGRHAPPRAQEAAPAVVEHQAAPGRVVGGRDDERGAPLVRFGQHVLRRAPREERRHEPGGLERQHQRRGRRRGQAGRGGHRRQQAPGHRQQAAERDRRIPLRAHPARLHPRLVTARAQLVVQVERGAPFGVGAGAAAGDGAQSLDHRLHGGAPYSLPGPMDAVDLAFAGAVRHAEMIRSREISARELIELYLERIRRLDPQLNAYRVVFDERALAEADQADGRAKAGDTRPLLGVPFAIKDDMDVAGESTAFGSDAHGGPVAEDAEVVRRLRSAGAVILGKTHVPEATITPWTESPTFGFTRNPWDRQRTPGGSSGGSGSAVAAGLCSAATASDGAGSIRIPAACCGLFGLKPQRGRVPTPAVDRWNGMSIPGVLTRGVADSGLVYDAIKNGGPSFADAAAREPGRLKIAMSVKTPPFTGVQADGEQLGGVNAVAETLRGLGHEVIEREIEYPVTLGGNVLLRYLRGIADQVRSMPHPERLSRRTHGYRRIGSAIPGALVARAKQAAADDERALALEGVDAVLTPMFTRRPPRVGEYDARPALWALVGSVRFVPYAGPYNHTGQPAASVPAAWTGDDFPVGAQLVAPRDGEPLLLSLAAQLEGALRWTERRPAMAI
jgi:amidase